MAKPSGHFERKVFKVKVCQICNKGSMIQKSGAHQYGGGWAMRATKKRVVWEPNLHKARVVYEGRPQTMRLCSKCLRMVKGKMKASAPEKKAEVKEEKSTTPTATA